MNSARMDGTAAWCGRPGCKYPNPLAEMQSSADGAAFARLSGLRWRRDGFHEGMERYVAVARRARVRRQRDDGTIEHHSPPEWRVQCPLVVVCPCGNVQAIGLTPPSPSR